MRRFISVWATEDHISPLSILRRWIRALSRVARVTPSATCILWDATNSSISVKGHVISLDAYKSHVRNTCNELVDFVNHHVLLDVKLPDKAYALPEEENDDINTRGFGLFALPAEALATGNHPSTIFLDALCRSGGLCQIHNGAIQWDPNELATWLANITQAWSMVLVLLHILSLPARGTEEVVWQHANSISSSRHLFLSPHLKTLVTQSNYSKTTAITGVYKYVIRPVPYLLAKVITILLRIIRPVEMMAVASRASEEQRHPILEKYSTHMFVSAGNVWNSEELSAALKHWYMEKLGIPFGLNLHRHFAQALQRKFHSYGNQGQNLGDVANRGLGHSREVADMNYARQPGDLGVGVSDRQRFEEVGMGWITWHGMAVSPSPTPQDNINDK